MSFAPNNTSKKRESEEYDNLARMMEKQGIIDNQTEIVKLFEDGSIGIGRNIDGNNILTAAGFKTMQHALNASEKLDFMSNCKFAITKDKNGTSVQCKGKELDVIQTSDRFIRVSADYDEIKGVSYDEYPNGLQMVIAADDIDPDAHLLLEKTVNGFELCYDLSISSDLWYKSKVLQRFSSTFNSLRRKAGMYLYFASRRPDNGWWTISGYISKIGKVSDVYDAVMPMMHEIKKIKDQLDKILK